MRELRKMVDLTATIAPHAAKRARPTGSAAPKPATAAEAIAAGVLDAAPRARRKLQPPAEMVSAKDIVAELAALTAHRTAVADVVDPPTPVVHAAPAASLPAAKKRLRSPAPRSAPAAAPAADAPDADSPVDATRHAVTPAVAAPVAAPVAAVAPVSAIAPVSAAAPVSATVATAAPVLEMHTEIVTCNDDGTTPVTVVSSAPEFLPIPTVVAAERARPAGPPSRSHIELTLAAADQLIDSLSRTANVQRLSVRVALRAGDQREVEVEAQWEATAPVISADAGIGRDDLTVGKRKQDSAGGEIAGAHAPAVSAGPLARWRLLLAVGVSGVTTGSTLWAAVGTGEQLDVALLRSFGVWFLTWVSLGRINRVLRQAAAGQVVGAAVRASCRCPRRRRTRRTAAQRRRHRTRRSRRLSASTAAPPASPPGATTPAPAPADEPAPAGGSRPVDAARPGGGAGDGGRSAQVVEQRHRQDLRRSPGAQPGRPSPAPSTSPVPRRRRPTSTSLSWRRDAQPLVERPFAESSTRAARVPMSTVAVPIRFVAASRLVCSVAIAASSPAVIAVDKPVEHLEHVARADRRTCRRSPVP